MARSSDGGWRQCQLVPKTWQPIPDIVCCGDFVELCFEHVGACDLPGRGAERQRHFAEGRKKRERGRQVYEHAAHRTDYMRAEFQQSFA
jgi:hypothetical protein